MMHNGIHYRGISAEISKWLIETQPGFEKLPTREVVALVREKCPLETPVVDKTIARAASDARIANGIRRRAPGTRTHQQKHGPRSKPAPALDLLVTIPLPKQQSATLTFDEARAVYEQLARVFGPKE